MDLGLSHLREAKDGFLTRGEVYNILLTLKTLLAFKPLLILIFSREPKDATQVQETSIVADTSHVKAVTCSKHGKRSKPSRLFREALAERTVWDAVEQEQCCNFSAKRESLKNVEPRGF